MKKILTLIFMVAFGISTINAQILSAGTGQWSAPATWVGGVVPTASDNVSIEAGHTVTVSNDLAAISFTDASLTSNVVTLTLGSGHGLVVGQPIIVSGHANSAFNGTYYVSASSATTITYPKTNANIAATGTGGSIAPQRNLNGTLTLNGGSLTIGSGAVLTMSGSAASIVRASASGTVSGTFTVAQLVGQVTTLNINVSCNSGIEGVNANSGANHLVIASGVTYTMASTRQADNVTLPATSTVAGSFALTIRGTISGTGTFTAPVLLRFGSGNKTISGVTFGALTVNYTGVYTLSGSPTVNGILTLTANYLTLSTFNLIIASTGSIATPSTASFIVTNSTGKLVMPVTGGVATVFPIGTTAASTNYTPVSINPANSVTFTVGVSQTLSPAVNVTANAVARIWDVSATSAGSTTLAFTAAAALLTGSNTPGSAVYGHYTGGSWKERYATYSAGTWTATHPSAAGFSPFGVGVETAFSPTVVLPIELSKFDVKATSNAALLTWSTASEKNNAVFNIEQSTNGVDFQNIGQVKGKGTTNVPSNYNFEHLTPSVGVNYYRLKQVDVDGAATYSAVRSVVFGKTGLIVKPTLAQDAINVVVSDETATTINIVNISGQIVLTAKAQGEQRIDVSTLPSGLYIVRNATGDVSRFVKQ